jgi:hypothetical protein
MAKAKTKTWKLGEICKGGIITVEVTGQKIAIIGKEWDYSKGSNRGSNQNGAKEWTRLEVEANEYDAERQVSNFLHDLTHSWAVDEIEKWIKPQVVYTANSWY